jgi:hypothetical protein
MSFKATVAPPVGHEGAAIPGLEQLINPFMKDTQLKMMEPGGGVGGWVGVEGEQAQGAYMLLLGNSARGKMQLGEYS